MTNHKGVALILVDLHAHTIASGHAFGTLDEMMRAAAALGRLAQAVTDHGPSMDGAPTVGYFEMVDRLPRAMHGVELLMGCEAAVMDVNGTIDLPDDVARLQRVLLAGLHARTPYPDGTSAEQNTDALVGAIANPAVDVISHPYRDGFPVDPRVVAEAAAACGTMLEVNVSALWRPGSSPSEASRPVVSRTRDMVQHLLHCGGEFVVCSDAHHCGELAVGVEVLDVLGSLLGVSLHPTEAGARRLLDRLAGSAPVGPGADA